MSRTYFPTRNDNGVRDMSQSVTLGAYLYTDYRGPAEPAPKGAMNPVNLGSLLTDCGTYPSRRSYDDIEMYRSDVQDYNVCRRQALQPAVLSAITPVRSTLGPVTGPVMLAPPVSAQSTPTPQVRVNAVPQSNTVLVTSGGGTLSPAPVPAAAQAGVTQSPTTSTVNVTPAGSSMADQVAAWLGGTTPIFSYNVPNALLAGGVILGFAMFMGGGGPKRR